MGGTSHVHVGWTRAPGGSLPIALFASSSARRRSHPLDPQLIFFASGMT